MAQLLASGMAALDAGDFATAERCFRELVSQYPRDHAAWNALAWASLRGGQADTALGYALHAHKLDRRRPEYLNTAGVAYGELANYEEAESHLRKALKLKPDFLEAVLNLGKVLQKQQRLPEALKTFERAHGLNPLFPNLAVTLARLYRQIGDADRAKSVLESSARAIEPQDLSIALAECDFELQGEEAAISRLRLASAEHPDWRLARLSLSYFLLSIGRWQQGWAEYRWRTTLPYGRPSETLDRLPERLGGKRVLLRAEQGIGDVLFFLRFAPLLRERGAILTLECEKKLHPILSAGALLDAVREAQEGDDAFDHILWLGDLPGALACGHTPPAWPVSLPEEAKSAAIRKLGALGPAPYLAVTWRAGTDVLGARELDADGLAAQRRRASLMKVVPPPLLGASLRGWRGTLIVLQREASPEERLAFREAVRMPVHDLSHLSEDLASLSATLSVIDEYVAVSNTNVHLLAGLGKTARVLVPYPGEWRWTRQPGPSPWFPGCATYREPQTRDWAAPLAQLRADLTG